MTRELHAIFSGAPHARKSRWGRWCLLSLVLGACGVSLPACQPEKKEALVNPFFANLPGAEYGMAVKRDLGDYEDPGKLSEDDLVVETEPGEVKLLARSVRHLMIHIHNTLEEDQRDLFVDQVLSEATKLEFRDRGLEPGVAFDFLQSQRAEIDALFNSMPGGESTPGLFLRPVGDRTYRIALDGMQGRDLGWVGMDVVLEGGNYKLRWFVDRAALAKERRR